MFVVCCQVEVSATSWALVQRSPTDCGASLCVIKKPRGTRRPQTVLGCRARETNNMYIYYKKKLLFDFVRCRFYQEFVLKFIYDVLYCKWCGMAICSLFPYKMFLWILFAKGGTEYNLFRWRSDVYQRRFGASKVNIAFFHALHTGGLSRFNSRSVGHERL
jgi:hypothetical protein